MLRRLFVVFYVLFAISSLLTAQEKTDSIISDTTSAKPIIVLTEQVLNDVFRSEPVLNNADSIIKRMDELPSFGIYKDNYFVVGTQMFAKPTKYNSDVKFQLSIRQIVTNSVLPLKTYLFFTYSQLAYWDIFQESLPFRDLNFNPTLGVGKYLVHNNRYIGGIALQLEHESNGKDGDASRSWNKISFGSNLYFQRSWMIQTKLWIPIVDGENNKDIVKYKGWGFIGANYRYKDCYFGAVLTKRGGWNLNHNLQLSMSYKHSKEANQYLFIEYYNGYGESLLDYNQFRHRIRVGFVIKSPLSTVF